MVKKGQRSLKSISKEISKIQELNKKSALLVQERNERQKLEAQLKQLKNPNSSAFRNNLQRGLKSGGKGVLNYLDRITRPVPASRPRRRRR